MTHDWTFHDFLLQWIWVGIIVICAVVMGVRSFIRNSKRKGLDDVCGGCPLKDDCRKSPSECDNVPGKNDRGPTSCGV